MNAAIRDKEAVSALRPTDTALYLRATGWSQKLQNERVSFWFYDKEEQCEILLPMNAEAGDYALRMGEMLQTLTIIEKRSQLQIYNDLLTVGHDAVRIRIDDPEIIDGSLPIEQHAQIAQKTRELVLAAACAAIEPRPFWPTRKPAQAMEHIRRVRIGQSERGSYIVTVLCRVTPLLRMEQSLPLFESEETFERQATLMLARSLHALDRASGEAATTQEIAVFDRAVSEGVSANLCDAVVGLWGDENLQRKVEFLFSWSPTRPINRSVVSRIALSSDRIPVIRAAGIQMREKNPLSDFELTGPIVKLERADGASSGKVTLIALIEERQARVIVELDDQLYKDAVSAHKDGRIVKLNGILTKEGRSFILKNPRDMIVITE